MCVYVGTCGPAEKSNFETSVLRLLSAKYCDDKYLGETGDCVCGACVCVCVVCVCVCVQRDEMQREKSGLHESEMLIQGCVHSGESGGGEEDCLDSGDCRSLRIAINCFFLSIGA